MKKLALAAVLVFLVSSAVAVDAVISPSNPDDIELNSGNSFEKNKTFDARSSSGQGTLTYTWNWEEESESDSGIETEFAFDRDKSQTNTIKLTVSNGTHSDVDEVTQVLHDEPNITISGDSHIDFDDDTGDTIDVTYTSTVTNEFDSPVDYNWTLDDKEKSTSDSATISFDEPSDQQDFDLVLNVTDDAGHFGSTSMTVTTDNETSSSSSSTTTQTQAAAGGNQTQQQQQQEAFDVVKEVLIDIGQTQDIPIDDGPLNSIAIESAGQVVTGDIKINNLDSRPSSADSDPPGRVYRYMEVESEGFDNSEVSSVEFEFEVDGDWVQDNSVAPETVVLRRYDGGWEKLETSLEDQDPASYGYTSTGDGFSAFSITGEGFDSLVNVTGVELNATGVKKGEAVAINVTVENTASSSTDYELEVDAGGQTLAKTLEGFDAGETRTVTFETSFGSTGSKTVAVGGQEVELEVGGGGIPWMMIGGVILSLLLAIIVFLFYPDIRAALSSLAGGSSSGTLDEAESVLETVVVLPLALIEKVSGLPGKLEELVSGGEGSSYSFEGFGDEDFDYSFEDN